MEKFISNLKEQAEEQPLLALTVGATAITLAVSVLKVLGDIYGRYTWSKEVARRSKKTKKK